MAALTDALGLDTSSDDRQSLASFERALDSLFRSDGQSLATIEDALARDPAFVAGHCLRAALLILRGTDAPAAALAASIDAIAARNDANARERRHAAAAACWLHGDASGALRHYGALVVDHPRDRLALAMAHALDFRLGQRTMLRDRIAAVLPHWNARDRGYAHVLAMHAFGLEETGDYDGAQDAARRSLDLVPDNPAAIHVIAHVHEMRDSPGQGIEWLRATQPVWGRNPGFGVHLAWHLALFQLDADRVGEALATYDTLIAPRLAGGNGALVDASALLWRLKLLGTGSQGRWREVTGRWMRQRAIGTRAFELIHAVIAFAASRQYRRARRLARRLEHDALIHGRSGADELAVARPLARAVIAFCHGDYGRAVASIEAIRAAADRCGGSVAQCDLIHLTLLEAALRARRDRLARVLASERAARRPASRLNRWLKARAWRATAAPGMAAG
jgi:hypothetical protein